MNVIENTGVKSESAKKLVESLNVYLANLHVHFMNLRGYHWHVQGIAFFGLHEKLEELYDAVYDQIDAVAERIIQLDGVPVRHYDEIQKLATIKQAGVVTDSNEIIKAYLQEQKVLVDIERKGIEEADELSDVVTSDMLTGYLAEHEKMAWMFTAYLK